MSETITNEKMRTLEEAAIQSGSVTGLELMERAGLGVVDAICEVWPDFATGAHRALVLCGPGNNGGDGFVVARLLREMGWTVSVALSCGLDALKGDARINALRVVAQDADLTPFTSEHLRAPLEDISGCLVVDALLGIGQTRSADILLDPFLTAMDGCAMQMAVGPGPRAVSIDIPTGYNTDTGACLAQNPFEPDLIVTFHRKKPVHEILEAQGYPVIVKDIGL